MAVCAATSFCLALLLSDRKVFASLGEIMSDLECVLQESSEGVSAAYRGQICIGGVSVRVNSSRDQDVKLDATLEPFRSEIGDSDIDIAVEWVPELSQSTARRLFDSGTTWRLHECEGGFQFDFGVLRTGSRIHKRLLVDKKFRRAALQMNESFFVDFPRLADPLAYPLDELLIMHRLTQEKAIELHGSGIVRADGTGNLFVGHSGAGKSTTTRLWTEREDVEVLSDDRIIVRREEDAVEIPRHASGAASEQQVLRLRDCSASRTNHSVQDDKLKTKHSAQDDKLKTKRFAQDDKLKTKRFAQDDKLKTKRFAQDDKSKSGGMRMYGTPWHGEAMYASPNSAPLSRIFIIEHGRGNVLTRLSPSQAVAELFARSFVPFHRHEYVDSALEFLQELVGAVPVYHYAFEPTEAAVERIREFRD